MMYACMYACGCVCWHDKTKTTDRNDLKLGTVVVFDTMSKSVDFGFKAWAPARGEQGGQAPTLEKIRVGMAHPGNFSRGLKTSWQ